MEKALRRGDENRPPTPDFRKYPVEWYRSSPAPSLRELARPQGVTEGVSSDGCSMPTIYTPAHIGSETFDRLRSSKYTPSVSHSLDSSLREGAGNGCVPFIVPPGNRNVCGRFSSPLRNSEDFGGYHSMYRPKLRFFTLHHSSDGTPSVSLRSTAPSEREPGMGCAIHRTARKPERLRAIFIAPTKTQRWGHCTIHRGACQSAALHSSFSTKEMGGGMAAAHWGVIALLRICTLRPRRFSGSTWG